MAETKEDGVDSPMFAWQHDKVDKAKDSVVAAARVRGGCRFICGVSPCGCGHVKLNAALTALDEAQGKPPSGA